MITDDTVAAAEALTAWLDGHRTAPAPFACYIHPQSTTRAWIAWHLDTDEELAALRAATPGVIWVVSQIDPPWSESAYANDGDVYLTHVRRAPAEVTP